MHADFENRGVTLETVGTQGTYPNNHEGRSGWSANTYCTQASAGGLSNPFYNNGFDAGYYFTQTGITVPDWFIINLGINDLFSPTTDIEMETAINTFIRNIDTMITSIKNVSNDIKIGVAITIPPNYSQDAFGKAYKLRQTRDRYKRNNFFLVERIMSEYGNRISEDGIYIIPINNGDKILNIVNKTSNILSSFITLKNI